MHAFAKKGTKPKPYRTKPYALHGEKDEGLENQEEKKNNERLRAKLYMKQMMRAGKNWGKGAAEK